MNPPLALCLHSAAIDRVHYALTLMASALATGSKATLFVAGPAVLLLAKTAPDGGPGWHGLLPDAAGRVPAAFEAQLAQKGIGTLVVLVEAIAELGGEVLVCEMALRLAGLAAGDLSPQLKPQLSGAVTYLSRAAGATSLFI
jgi:peroxiredoxin family protein